MVYSAQRYARQVAIILTVAVLFIVFSFNSVGQEVLHERKDLPRTHRRLSFEVASIREHREGSEWRMQFTPDGFIATDVTLEQLIEQAYNIYQKGRISGGPSWIRSTKFDVIAKMGTAEAQQFERYSLNQRRAMLQTLLKNRFRLRVHSTVKQLRAYALVVAKNGPKLDLTSPSHIYRSQIKGINGLVTESAPGLVRVQDFTMKGFSRLLYQVAGLRVINRTGLTGRYDFTLRWRPEENRTTSGLDSGDNPGNPAPSSDFPRPPIFSAVKEQLGLKLNPIKYPLNVIVIDSAQKPALD